MSESRQDLPRIAITVGDFNGVGIEVIMKTLSDNRMLGMFTPVIYGSTRILSYYKKLLDKRSFNYSTVEDAEGARPKNINVVNCWKDEVSIDIGKGTPESGRYAVMALRAAVDDLAAGKVHGLVTAPIAKSNVQGEEFPYAGHTEFLAERLGEGKSLMFMVGERLRMGLISAHIPLSEAAGSVQSDVILGKLKLMQRSLREDFGISKPRIAVLGLNPHAGDAGLIGMEEIEQIIPAIEDAQQAKMMVFGPYPSDGFFGNGHYAEFDGVLAMYHDQGLIPFKTLEFGSGVNFTAGLKAVRTSPDHGTAFDIAGKDLANPDSFRKAIFLCLDILRRRAGHSG